MSIQRCVFFIVTIYASVSYVSSEQGDILHLDANWNSVENLTEPPSVEGEILATNDFPEPIKPLSPPPPLNEFREPSLPSSPLSLVSDEVVIRPVLPNLKPVEILNRESIKIEGFDHIHRRTVKHLTKNHEVQSPLSVSSNVQSDEIIHVIRRSAERVTEDVQKEEFLPIEHKPGKLPSMEEFDLTSPETSDSSSDADSEDGSGIGEVDDTTSLVRAEVESNGSSVSLIPGPGLLHGVFHSSNNTTVQADEQSSHHVSSETTDDQDETVDVDHLFELAGPPTVKNERGWWDSEWASETSTEQESSQPDPESSFETTSPPPVNNEGGTTVQAEEQSSHHVNSETTDNQDETVAVDHLFELAGPPPGKNKSDWWHSEWESETSTKQEAQPDEGNLLEIIGSTSPSTFNFTWSSEWASEKSTQQESFVHDEDDAEDLTEESEITPVSTGETGDESDGNNFSLSFTAMNPSAMDEVPTVLPAEGSPEHQDPSLSQSSHIHHNSTNSNSTGSRFRGPLVYILRSDGPLAQFVNKHAAVLVGIMMAIPAMIILLYFIHLRRRRGYTGSLYVSPASVHTFKKKSRSGVTFCSYENEISMAPSTSSTPPKPPPLPKK